MANIKKKIYREFQGSESAGVLGSDPHLEKRPILFISDLPFSPPTDVWETEKDIHIMMEVADLSATDFRINYRDGYLIIAGERLAPGVITDSVIVKYHKKEIDYGSFQVKLKMNTRIKSEKISARYKNGILSIILAKNFSKAAANDLEIQVSGD